MGILRGMASLGHFPVTSQIVSQTAEKSNVEGSHCSLLRNQWKYHNLTWFSCVLHCPVLLYKAVKFKYQGIWCSHIIKEEINTCTQTFSEALHLLVKYTNLLVDEIATEKNRGYLSNMMFCPWYYISFAMNTQDCLLQRGNLL